MRGVMQRQPHVFMRVGQRGSILVISILTALVCGIGAYAMLMIAMASARTATFFPGRSTARYAAEAGIVWAQDRLMDDPTYCGVPGPPAFGALNVVVTVSNCGAGNSHVITSKVVY